MKKLLKQIIIGSLYWAGGSLATLAFTGHSKAEVLADGAGSVCALAVMFFLWDFLWDQR